MRRLPILLILLALAGAGPAVPVRAATPAAVAGCATEAAPMLAFGDTGPCVTAVQHLLGEAGYDLPDTGRFDADTRAAVRRFQASRQGVAITGRVTPETWAALAGAGRRYSIERGPVEGDHVLLTFDDCPTSLAAFRATLLAAERAGIRLVLFPYGTCQAAGLFDEDFARAHGHPVYSHSATHAHLDALPRAGVLTELDEPAIQGGYGRPPYGGWNWTVLDAFAERGMRLWTWTLDTLDWMGRSRAELVDDVVRHAVPGDSVLLHMQYAGFDAAALTAIKDGLAARGLAVCRNTGPVSADTDPMC
nr:polysaccharide deacetylase family protein [Propionibacterium sp.]